MGVLGGAVLAVLAGLLLALIIKKKSARKWYTFVAMIGLAIWSFSVIASAGSGDRVCNSDGSCTQINGPNFIPH